MDMEITTADDLDDTRWRAVCERDAGADGEFVYGVMTTGVYCRPSCPSRGAKRENVRFYRLHAEAERNGLRPCKRCNPTEPSVRQQRVALTEHACRIMNENDPDLTITALAERLGVSRHHFQRVFKEQTGVTPKAYQQAIRRDLALASLASGSRVTDAMHDGGYGSASSFYEGAARDFGMAPSKVRKGADGETIRFAFASTTLGRVIVARSVRGICAVRFGDDDDELTAELRERFPKADLEHDGGGLGHDIAIILQRIERPEAAEELPLDIQGTAFQQSVWAALRAIPMGETASYADVATAIGRPTATRAVAQACGANPVAVVVPCHRVVRTDGGLSGYRWGPERKRALLEREGAL